jgi:deoxyribose-phosphate aldolase
MSDPVLTARQLLPLLDLTCLDEDATPAQIGALCARADGPHGRVAAVCVYPEHLQHARSLLPESIAVATVVNFPEGGEDPLRVAREIRRARAVGAQEIDAVLPWQALLQGREGPSRQVLRAAREASGGATLPAAQLMLDTIRRRAAPAGFKAAGGLRSLAQAEPYLRLVERELGEDARGPARLRFGASGLLDQIEAALEGRLPTDTGTY